MRVFPYLCILTGVGTCGGQRLMLCIFLIVFYLHVKLRSFLELQVHLFSKANQWDSWSSCLYLSSSRTMDMLYHTRLRLSYRGAQDSNSVPHVASTLPTDNLPAVPTLQYFLNYAWRNQNRKFFRQKLLWTSSLRKGFVLLVPLRHTSLGCVWKMLWGAGENMLRFWLLGPCVVLTETAEKCDVGDVLSTIVRGSEGWVSRIVPRVKALATSAWQP